jgi:hypothetical protein
MRCILLIGLYNTPLAAAVDIHDASLTAAAGNILLVDVENACLVARGHASF